MSNAQLHQANPDTSNFLHPRVYSPFNFLYSLFLIFFKRCLVPLCTHGPPGFISLLQPTQLTGKSHQCSSLRSLLSMPSSTSYCHCLHLGTHHFLDGQFLLLPFPNLAPHQPSTTNIIYPPQIWLYQCSVRILQGPSLLRAGKTMAYGKNLAHDLFLYKQNSCTNSTLPYMKKSINNEKELSICRQYRVYKTWYIYYLTLYRKHFAGFWLRGLTHPS